MTDPALALIVDDEPDTRALLELRLADAGFDVASAPSGPGGLKLAYERHPDAIILDVMMPEMDGFEVCRRLRQQTDAVIVFVSCKGRTEDIITGLHAGADDYLVKPYRHKELLARLQAALRRRDRSSASEDQQAQEEPALTLDPERRLVSVDGQAAVQLTAREFELLEFMAKNSGHVLRHNAILANVWGADYIGASELVKQFIYRLRSKLEPDPSNPQHILTVRGSGYILEVDAELVVSRDRPAGAAHEDDRSTS